MTTIRIDDSDQAPQGPDDQRPDWVHGLAVSLVSRLRTTDPRVAELSGPVLGVFIWAASFTGTDADARQDPLFFASVERVAERAGVSPKAAQRALRILCRAELFEHTGRRVSARDGRAGPVIYRQLALRQAFAEYEGRSVRVTDQAPARAVRMTDQGRAVRVTDQATRPVRVTDEGTVRVTDEGTVRVTDESKSSERPKGSGDDDDCAAVALPSAGATGDAGAADEQTGERASIDPADLAPVIGRSVAWVTAKLAKAPAGVQRDRARALGWLKRADQNERDDRETTAAPASSAKAGDHGRTGRGKAKAPNKGQAKAKPPAAGKAPTGKATAPAPAAPPRRRASAAAPDPEAWRGAPKTIQWHYRNDRMTPERIAEWHRIPLAQVYATLAELGEQLRPGDEPRPADVNDSPSGEDY